MKKIILSVLSVGSIFLLNACYYDNFKELNPEPAITISNCDTMGTISYSAQIVPALASSCTNGCHNGVGSGHDLTNWAAVNFDAVDPGGGKLISSIIWDGNAQQMPQGASSKISECDIAKIKKWVAQGALDN